MLNQPDNHRLSLSFEWHTQPQHDQNKRYPWHFIDWRLTLKNLKNLKWKYHNSFSHSPFVGLTENQIDEFNDGTRTT